MRLLIVLLCAILLIILLGGGLVKPPARDSRAPCPCALVAQEKEGGKADPPLSLASPPLSVFPVPREYRVGGTPTPVDGFQISVKGKNSQSRTTMLKMLETLHMLPGNLPVVVEFLESSTFILNSSTDESYTMDYDGERVSVNAQTCLGAFRSIQTLQQLARAGNLPGRFFIRDAPSFRHRGLLIDTGRHYLPLHLIKKTIATMTQVKLNVLHWHMVDSQVFPYEPEFNKAMLNSLENKKYTAKDLKHLIWYAAIRGVRIIVEIDTPAHTYSWRKAYPELMVCDADADQTHQNCNEPPCGSLDVGNKPKQVLSVVTKVWDDIMESYMDDLVHLGGDEVKASCTPIKSVRRHLSNVAKHMFKLHKKASIIWEDSLPKTSASPYDKDTIIQTWLGSHTKNIIQHGHRVIITGVPLYLDVGRGTFFGDNPSWGGYATWRQIYKFDPAAEVKNQEDVHMILGAEVCAWGETIDETNFETLVWPRASAFAAAMWNRPKEKEGESELIEVWERMMYHREELVGIHGVRASPLAPRMCSSAEGTCAIYSRNRNLQWPRAQFNSPGPLCLGGPYSACDDASLNGGREIGECKAEHAGEELAGPPIDGVETATECHARGGVWDGDGEGSGGTCRSCPPSGVIDGGVCYKIKQHNCPANSICVRTTAPNWSEKGVCMCPCSGFLTSTGLQQQPITHAYDHNNWQVYSNL